MRLVRYSHSCVRLEHDGSVLVIDPGCWSEPAALDGADAVLLTHDHADHADPGQLAGLGVPVFGPAGSEVDGVEVTPVFPGDELTVAGLSARVTGGRHATTWDGRPDCANVGWLVAGVHHPGDALDPPPGPVETLLVPMHAPWLSLADAIGFLRAVGPDRAYGVHDGMLNDHGRASTNAWLSAGSPAYGYLPPGGVA